MVSLRRGIIQYLQPLCQTTAHYVQSNCIIEENHHINSEKHEAMPLYIYTCNVCDIDIEELRSIETADWPPVECPVCHELCSRTPSTFHLQRPSAATKTANSADIEQDIGAIQIFGFRVLHKPIRSIEPLLPCNNYNFSNSPTRIDYVMS